MREREKELMKTHYDVAIIGGGIVGLAHAWTAARRGLSVGLFERSAVAEGATIRNFGMVWPIGQPEGSLYTTAIRSRNYWLKLKEVGVLEVEECGSLHAAFREDEWSVIQEFAEKTGRSYELLTAEETRQRSPFVKTGNLIGALWSPEELRVDPRTAPRKIADWLQQEYAVDTRFATTITAVEGGQLTAANGDNWTAERVVICSGSDLRTLFPEIFADAPLVLCKLQMLRSERQPNIPAGSPHIAGGLTLQHYASFKDCSSLGRLRDRIAEETPELNRYGIHVMASPRSDGTVILGDSHEYGQEITPFDSPEIDQLIMRELGRLINLPVMEIAERWHGVYAKHPDAAWYEAECADGVKVFTGTGGAGMTMSFGLAAEAWERWTGISES